MHHPRNPRLSVPAGTHPLPSDHTTIPLPSPVPADPADLRRTIIRTLNTGKSGSIPEETLDIALRAVLQTWTPLREKHPLSCQIRRHLRQSQITLILPGRKTNPLILPDSEETSVETLFQTASLRVSYQYQNGENRLTLRQARKNPLPISRCSGRHCRHNCRAPLPVWPPRRNRLRSPKSHPHPLVRHLS